MGKDSKLTINDNEVDTVDQAVVAIEVGIGLDFECSKNSVIYVLQANDDRIWSTALPALMVNS